MEKALMILILISSVILIINVLLQEDKTGGISSSLGGGTENVWEKNKGKSLDSILDKMVIATSIIIMVSSIALVAIKK